MVSTVQERGDVASVYACCNNSDVYLSAAAKLRREIWATHLATLPIKDTLIKYMVLQIIQNIKHTPRQCYSHSVVHRRRERICAMQNPKCQQGTGLQTLCPYRTTQLAHIYSEQQQ